MGRCPIGIELGSNFSEQAAIPLDDRYSFADITARDALAAGRRYEGMVVYVVSTATRYILGSDLTTWTAITTGGGSEILTGNGAPTMLTVVPTGSPQFYMDLSTILTNQMVSVWAYVTSKGYWYPTSCCRLAYHVTEGLTVTEVYAKDISKVLSDNISLTEAVVKTIAKVLNESLSISESLEKGIYKVIGESIDITENVAIKFEAVKTLNGGALNTGSLN